MAQNQEAADLKGLLLFDIQTPVGYFSQFLVNVMEIEAFPYTLFFCDRKKNCKCKKNNIKRMLEKKDLFSRLNNVHGA